MQLQRVKHLFLSGARIAAKQARKIAKEAIKLLRKAKKEAKNVYDIYLRVVEEMRIERVNNGTYCSETKKIYCREVREMASGPHRDLWEYCGNIVGTQRIVGTLWEHEELWEHCGNTENCGNIVGTQRIVGANMEEALNAHIEIQ